MNGKAQRRDIDAVFVAACGAGMLLVLAVAAMCRVCGCGWTAARIQPAEHAEHTEEGDAAMNRFYAGVVGEC